MKTFSFNLLPQKTKEQVHKEEKRDQTGLYTAVFPLLATIIWLGITLFNGIYLQSKIKDLSEQIAVKQGRVEGEFLPVRIQHGELVIKTAALAEVIDKDIKPESLFILTQKIFPTEDPQIQITGYGRYSDGGFGINLTASTYEKLNDVVRRFSKYPGTYNVRISSANRNDKSNQIAAVINFNLDIAYLEANK